MSLERFAAEMIMGLAKHGEGIGKVAMLGRQHLDLPRHSWADEVETRLGYDLHDLIADQDETYAEPFFERMGAKSVESIDFSPYQGAKLIHDMNTPLLPELQDRFDLLHDGGTMEHVFHIPNYLANCMKLLRVGGVYVGVTPADNWMGHGFYQFSPELLFRVFCPENGFRLRAHGFGTWEWQGRVYNMPPDNLWRGRMEPQFRKPALLLIVAQKTASVEPFSAGWPQQSDYASRWSNHEDGSSDAGSSRGGQSWIGMAGRLLPSQWRQRLKYELAAHRHRRLRNQLIREVSSADMLIQG